MQGDVYIISIAWYAEHAVHVRACEYAHESIKEGIKEYILFIFFFIMLGTDVFIWI